MRILVVEDEPTLCDQLSAALSEQGYAVDIAANGEDALHMGTEEAFDAAILDLGLPKLDGTSVLKGWRAAGKNLPVIILTARDNWGDKVSGIDAGADDYLGKPFDLEEVEARLRALVRRTQGVDDEVQVGQLRLNRKLRRIFMGDADLALPAREFEVLCELMTPPGRAVSKRVLSDKLSGFDEALGDNALEAFISRLRKKLADSGASIRTLRGIGYVLEEQP